MNKVARVDFAFWVMKVCATTLGETAGDLVSMTLGVGYALGSTLLLGVFLVSLLAQLRARAFRPALYWSVILTTSTAGTTMSDFIDRSLGLGYAKGSLILVSGLATVLIAWRFFEGSLSVTHIEGRTEIFYWIAILFSNTLGTALGDFLADDSGLGFLGSAALIGSAIALTALAAFWTRIDRVVLFWIAFVLTRPFGATFGDLLTKPAEKGGLDFGTVGASLLLASLLLIAGVATSRASRLPGESRFTTK
ncbi:MAG TPA: hypothetical protein VFY49_02375 [Myxococcota bacterium]|nr:hypothetical protein [Myxococcota bacterium]